LVKDQYAFEQTIVSRRAISRMVKEFLFLPCALIKSSVGQNYGADITGAAL
jgi:hypothetical protein